jgi:hypothetical protein
MIINKKRAITYAHIIINEIKTVIKKTKTPTDPSTINQIGINGSLGQSFKCLLPITIIDIGSADKSKHIIAMSIAETILISF